MSVRLCAGISIHDIATGNLTVNLGKKDCEVVDKRQGSRVPNRTLFSKFSVKILQHFLNLITLLTYPPWSLV